jgi:hypothetical protein
VLQGLPADAAVNRHVVGVDEPNEVMASNRPVVQCVREAHAEDRDAALPGCATGGKPGREAAAPLCEFKIANTSHLCFARGVIAWKTPCRTGKRVNLVI